MHHLPQYTLICIDDIFTGLVQNSLKLKTKLVRNLCYIVKNFEVPAESDLWSEFVELLVKNDALAAKGKGGIIVGTKAQVLSRTCPFCRFTVSAVKTDPTWLDDLKDDDLFLVQMSPYKDFLWLRFRSGTSRSNWREIPLMFPGEQLVLVSRTAEGGPKLGRLVDSTPNYDQMKYWLQLCDTDPLHRGICTGAGVIKSNAMKSLPKLRVVDVEDMCLVEIDWHERYVTLSYVWGGASPPKLLGSQLAAYSERNALQNLLGGMPNTIQDAFTFTKKIGLRYLWFDSLCLIQDDLESLLKGIMNMQLIYESSYVTLISADTESADNGIPGIGVLRREVNQDRQFLKPGLEIMRVQSIDHHLKKSRWNTRGWTMQEYYLSRRTITFVNNQAYFRCRQRNWYEELWTDLDPQLPRGSDMDVMTFARDNMDQAIESNRNVSAYTFLFQLLEIYQNRNLTDENDALNAVTGILQRVAASASTEMIQGLPAGVFPLALLFIHTGRRAPRRRKNFPSWSWCGWKGEISWYPFDKLDLMSAANETNDFSEDKELEKTLTSSWITYHVTRGVESSQVVWTPSSRLDATVDFESLQNVLGFASSNLDSAALESTTIKELQEKTFRNYPLLIFQTVVLHYRIKTLPETDEEGMYDLEDERPEFKDYHSRTYEISGRDNEDCGTLYADKRLMLEADNVTKFVVLDRCHKIEFPLEFELDEEPFIDEPVFWVMMIRLVDNVWERRGIGQLLQSSFAKSFAPDPRWERIVLG